MNLVQIQDRIRAVFSGLVSDVYFGDPLYHFSNDKVDYASVVFAFQNVTVGEDTVTYRFSATFADRLTNGTTNGNNIFVDALNTLEKGFNMIETDEVEVDYNRQYEPFKQKFADVLAGLQCEIDVITTNDLKCD